MLITPNLWHPAGAARQYEAAGSRTAFIEKWNPTTMHSCCDQEQTSDALQLMIDVLTDEQKTRWLYNFDTAA